MKFEAKKKTMEVVIDGVSHKVRYPSMGEYEGLISEMEQAKTKGSGVFQIYYSYFEKLGLPVSEQKKMDAEDFNLFIEFVLNPKKNSAVAP